MKRKNIKLVLCIAGIGLLTTSIVLTVVAMATADIIGGAGLPTLMFIFLNKNDGLQFILALLGLLLIVTSIFIKKGEKQ